jgi:hypothetical protein
VIFFGFGVKSQVKLFATSAVLYYIYYMTVTQTVDIPADHRLIIDVPREVPAGRAVLSFTPAVPAPPQARTVAEALYMAAERAADPAREPLSRLFGIHPGLLGGDGVAYQRAIRDEWD